MNLGYACINLALAQQGIFTNRGMIRRTFWIKAFNTWAVRPVFHFSSSRKQYEDPTCKREAHADYVYEPINTYGKEIDIILEAKMKELSILKYWNDYSSKNKSIHF